jgi:hypothetical protein
VVEDEFAIADRVRRTLAESRVGGNVKVALKGGGDPVMEIAIQNETRPGDETPTSLDDAVRSVLDIAHGRAGRDSAGAWGYTGRVDTVRNDGGIYTEIQVGWTKLAVDLDTEFTLPDGERLHIRDLDVAGRNYRFRIPDRLRESYADLLAETVRGDGSGRDIQRHMELLAKIDRVRRNIQRLIDDQAGAGRPTDDPVQSDATIMRDIRDTLADAHIPVGVAPCG